jgi:peptidoglycan/xylan/chitin deacetylase (PgdA/CDA1 family)
MEAAHSMKARAAAGAALIGRALKSWIWSALCALGAARGLRWLSRRAFPGAVRVLYCHEVLPCRARTGSEDVGAPGRLTVAELERRLLHVKRHYGFISMDQALSRLRGATPGSRVAVALTFDDGYRGFAQHVHGLLRRHGVPATLCVTTAAVGTRGLWTDEVRAAVAQPALVSVVLPVSGRRLDLGGALSRAQAGEALIAELKRTPDEKRRRLVRELGERAGVPPESERRMLSWEELRELVRDPLVTIGAHTIGHPILSRMREDEAGVEIHGSRRHLERELGIPITIFSYPNGTGDDFTDACRRMARVAGYRVALSTIGGLARPGCDLYALPRTCLAAEPWPRFVLRMAGLDDVLERIRGRRRRGGVGRGEPAGAAETPARLPSLAGDAGEH